MLDALNFCFWPSPGVEYVDLAVSLKRVLENDPHAFDANRLMALNEADFEQWFPLVIPNSLERVRRLRELGEGLQEGPHFSLIL